MSLINYGNFGHSSRFRPAAATRRRRPRAARASFTQSDGLKIIGIFTNSHGKYRGGRGNNIRVAIRRVSAERVNIAIYKDDETLLNTYAKIASGAGNDVSWLPAFIAANCPDFCKHFQARVYNTPTDTTWASSGQAFGNATELVGGKG